jgi:hypothetical protein
MKTLLLLIMPITAAVLLTPGFSACGTRGEAEAELEDPPIITSATYQHTLYNGQPQAIDARSAKEDAPPFIITYFPSEEALLNNEGGVPEPPADVGSYYVRIKRPAGNGYREGPDIKVEYYIQKTFVPVSAEERQEFFYDGNPKPAAADAPVELAFTYYSADAPQSPLEGPPVEPGVYRVALSYPGNDRYMGFSKELELVIRKR